jgi:hypothetical protein
VDFINPFSLALILSTLGILVTLIWGFQIGLFYSLVIFPLAFEFFYFEILVPHLPLFLNQLNINTFLFSGLYAILLIFLFFKRWNYLALTLFLVGFIHVEKNMPQQLWAALSYRVDGAIQPTILRHALARIDKDEHAPVYLICLDGYPDLTKTEIARSSLLDSLLLKLNFHSVKHVAKGFQTPVALRYLITGKYKAQEFTNLNGDSFSKELTQGLSQVSPQDYQVYLGTILTDYHLSKPFFPVFSSIQPNRLLVKSLKHYFKEESQIGSSAAFEKYHQQLIDQIDGKQNQLKLLHFITFHGFSTEKREFLHDIPIADQLLNRILVQLKAKAPQAKVIIFSDHGERFTKGYDPRAAIFYSNF